jgi:tetratricopeptide (TPR) repeat protein
VTARIFVFTVLLAAATASAAEFYGDRMQRGMANYQRGNYAQAAADFRIAGFGLLESPAEYETALVYQVLANEKLARADEAAQAAEKIVTVERVAPVYATLRLSPAAREELESALPKLVRAEQLARAPSLAHLASRSTVVQPPPRPRVEATPPPRPPAGGTAAQAMSLLQGGDEAGARAIAEKIVADDYTNALAQTVLAILAGRRSDWPGVVEHYSVVRTRRRLTEQESSTFIMGLVRSGRTADAAGVEKLRGVQPFVARATTAPPPTPAAAPTLTPAPTTLLAEADRMLREGRVIAARDAFRRLGQTPNLPRDVALGAARGLNQTTAYRDSSAAYQKLYPLHAGEEVHMFYEAVNRYEMGDYAIAKKLMARALPSLPRTRDVELYRTRIERTQ